MNPTPKELRDLLRELVRQMGAKAAALHWLSGCPEQPTPVGPHSRADGLARLDKIARALVPPTLEAAQQ